MKLIYLINVDWFFVSHFLHLARRARDTGWQVTVATNFDRDRSRIEGEGFATIALPARRGSLLPAGLLPAAGLVADELLRSTGTVLHGFGLFGILVGTLACRRAGHAPRVYTITGRGYSGVSHSWKARLVRAGSRTLCSSFADGPSTFWLAENAADISACRLQHATAEGRTAIVGGAGVDPALFLPAPMPERPPLRCALVARMIWSKGIDTAVEAVRLARQAGADVTLSLAGPVDDANPRAWSAADVNRLASTPGVQWLGQVEDVAGLWSGHHVAVLPSRGGEGLPKSLIEAAAAGRPVLTTTVPGCAEFAAATGGWAVPPDDPRAFAQALIEAAGAADLERRGSMARAAVLAGYTEKAAWDAASGAYRHIARF